jgi:hypothetical protein
MFELVPTANKINQGVQIKGRQKKTEMEMKFITYPCSWCMWLVSAQQT